MYQPTHFVQGDAAQIRALVAAHPLATLFHQTGGAPTADHIPLLWESEGGDHGTLRGHVARANPLWREMDGRTVLAVFHGPQAYVTPSWYPSKSATAKVVPTWNYAVVHLRGTLRCVDDAAWLHGLVDRLTHRQEDARPHPWQVSDAPADYRDAMLRAIVGLEVAVTQVEAKWKVSQNRTAPDRTGVAEGMLAEGSDAARASSALIPR